MFGNVRVAAPGPARAFDFWSKRDALAEARERAASVLKSVGLERKGELLAAHLSHGEKRHLFTGTPDALRREPAIQHRFLGV